MSDADAARRILHQRSRAALHVIGPLRADAAAQAATSWHTSRAANEKAPARQEGSQL
jgi:phosphotransacetylase